MGHQAGAYGVTLDIADGMFVVGLFQRIRRETALPAVTGPMLPAVDGAGITAMGLTDGAR
jgi:hypothetical protein